MSSVAFELVAILLLIIINGFLAMSEMAIVSARKARLQQLAAKGDAGALAALSLAEEPSDFLASIQIGITLIGVLTGAFGGITIAKVVAAHISEIPWLARHADALGIGIVVAIVTYLSLVVGELVPKRIALANAELLAKVVARPLKFLAFLTLPAVRLLSYSTEVLVKLFGMGGTTESPVTEEEVKIMIEQGTAAGVFEREEESMMKRVLRLGDQTASAIMTPRLEVVFLDGDAGFAENLKLMMQAPHSYFPIYRVSQDDVIGLVATKDVMSRLASSRQEGKPEFDILALAREPLFVAESMPVLNLLEAFKKSARHIAVVVDEYGGTAGLVSLTDVLEAIAGDLTPGADDREDGAVQRADGSWLVDGAKSFNELAEMLRLDHDAIEEGKAGGFQSVGGFVMHQLRAIPRDGQSFAWRGFRIEVVDMDGRRVDKVLIVPLAQELARKAAEQEALAKPLL